MVRILALIALAGGLAACAGARGGPPEVSYRFQGDNITAANERADTYCRQFGRQARLQAVTRNGAEHVAVYECG